MLQKESKLTTADNTGVHHVKCIHVPKRKYAFVGDLIDVVVKKFNLEKTVVKKQIYYGLILTVKFRIYRQSGIFIKANFNKLVLLNKETKKFLGTSINAPAFKEILIFTKGKKKVLRFEKVVSCISKLV
jgi:ribosomal protein L14